MPLSGGGGREGGGVRLSGGPAFLDTDSLIHESDASSVVSISDTLRVSDTEEEGEWGNGGAGRDLVDKQKYRMPDAGKTRLSLRTKEPLSPSPAQTQIRPSSSSQQARPPSQPHSSPQTPRNGRAPPFDGTSPSPLPNGAGSETVTEIPSLSRSNSLYTLGRASLQDQLSQLMNMKLPDASSLAKSISEIPTSAEAAKTLSDASEQIRLWINKVSDVLNGLNAEDDVEWAAAGGREGIADVDKSITRFEGLVDVYLRSIDELQTRADIATLSTEDLTGTVAQVEGIVASWHEVKKMLGGVKEQVEVAMAWMEIWNNLLGDVAEEVESLNRLVFEMEERRHQGAGILTSKDSIDIGELQTIVEERPGGARTHTEGFDASLMAPAPALRLSSHDNAKDDTSLVALFARMQPLRAKLDFLPMKLSVFQLRGSAIFPSACDDLDLRRNQLEAQWTKLESDAEFLRRELGEDRWIVVFRGAGRKAMGLCDSMSRTVTKLKNAVEEREYMSNGALFSKRIGDYADKKKYYGTAIIQVLAIIDRGVQDRLTVNGEILRLQSDMRERWTSLQTAMRELDAVLEEINTELGDRQLRDSISTVLSSEPSGVGSMPDTPGSSPASSVVGSSRRSSYQGSRTPTPLTNAKTRPASFSQSGANRSSLPSSIPRRIPLTNSSSPLATRSASPSPLIARNTHRVSMTARLEPPTPSRPRWSQSTKLENRDFPSFSTLEPSPYARTPLEKRTTFLRATRTASQPVLTPLHNSTNSSLPSSRIPTTPATAPSLRMSKPTPPHPTSETPSPSTLTTPTLNRRSFLPVPSSAPAQLNLSTPATRKARTALRQPRSHASLRSGHSSSTGPSTRHSSVAPRRSADGNEADTEDKSDGRRRLSRSRFAISLREDGGGGGAGGAGSTSGRLRGGQQHQQQRPPWRP